MKSELIALLEAALADVRSTISGAYRPASAREERTETLLVDLIEAIRYADDPSLTKGVK